MPRVPFDALPGHGRLWVFPANRTLTHVEARACLEVVDEFLASWAAHGVPLTSGRELREGRFLLVGVDVDAGTPDVPPSMVPLPMLDLELSVVPEVGAF